MRSAKEELGFRLKFLEDSIVGRVPADSLPNHRKAFVYQITGWDYYAIYILKTALGIEEGAQNALRHVIAATGKALLYYPQDSLRHLQAFFIAKSLLGEDLSVPSRQIIEATKTNTNDYVSPLISVVACIRAGEDHTPYMNWLSHWETRKKYTSVLPGFSEAMTYLLSRDTEKLVKAINNMLLVHNNQANNRHSDIYNTYNSFLSLAPYFMLQLAEFFGMHIRSEITENVQIMKLGLMFPTESPELKKNYKMPIRVDYLTAKADC